MNNLGCYCGRCISDPDLEEHLKTEHSDNFDYHSATPVVNWSYDEEYHWKDCRFCDSEEHRTSLHEHSFDDYMECSICGYVGEIGPSIMGAVYSYGEEYTEITLELYLEGSNEPVKTLTLNGTYTSYFIKGIESGNYIIKVMKDGHTTRTYNKTIYDNTSVLDIYLNECGDANMNGVIDVLDYQQVINATLNDSKVPDDTTSDYDYALAICDYAQDGFIDVIDCAFMAIVTNAGSESSLYDSVEIVGLEEPAANSLPSYDVVIDDNKYELYPENYGYIYNGVTWYDLTTDSNIDTDDRFIPGHSYKVTVEVVPCDGEEGNLKYATINGNTATVEEASDCYLISCVFVAS